MAHGTGPIPGPGRHPSMNLLKSVETKISNLVEGAFGRVFRTEVRPMELARKLAREMDAHRTVSVSRVYVPNEYTIWLSSEDRARYEGIEGEVIEELSAYLLEHARREDLIMASSPVITFDTDERLGLGEFGIQARLVAPEPREPAAGAREEESRGHTMIYSTSARVGGPAGEARSRPRMTRALLVVGGRRILVPPSGGVIGRSRECEIVLDDAGISRRHAEVRPRGEGWVISDLGSTNGVIVDGSPLRGEHELRPGERIELGSTELLFEVS